MGKSSKWFSKLLRRCRHRHRHRSTVYSPANNGDLTMDCNSHAIAVAAATAAAAEAALAAANAAAEVVRLTSNPTGHFSRRWSHLDFAALKIQSVFRGYLARKALKALKGLVKLQALVRGHLVRKQSVEMLRRLQAMVRVQARARSTRVLNIESSLFLPDKETPRSNEIDGSREKLEDSPVLKRCGSNSSIIDSKGSDEKTVSGTNWLDNWVEVGSSIKNSNLQKTPHLDDEKNDKILEIDNWKPDSKPKSGIQNNHQPLRHISAQDYYNHSFAASDYLARYTPSKSNVGPFNEDGASLKSLQFPLDSSSPQASSRTGSMRKSPAKTPSRDECTTSYLNGFATFASPSYMANTKSSRARSRSISVPRQRGDDLEKVGSIKKSLHSFWESKNPSKRSLDASSNLSKQRW